MTQLTSKVPLLSPRMVPAALCWLFWNYSGNKVRRTGNKNVLRVSICFIWTQILSTITIPSFAPLLDGFCAEGEGTCWKGSA